MSHLPEQAIAIALNTQTVNHLIEQTELFLNQPEKTESGQKALENLKAALAAVLPYMPQPPQQQPDDLTLEQDIREEIRIAGANENG